MALALRLPRDSRLPVAFLTHRNSAYSRPSPQAFSPRPLTPSLSLLQTRTVTGYAGQRTPNELRKQPALLTRGSQSPGPQTFLYSERNSLLEQKLRELKKHDRWKQQLVSYWKDARGSNDSPFAGRDSSEVRLYKILIWLLRHGAPSEGLAMWADGFVFVNDILKIPRLKPLGLTLETLKQIVQADPKQQLTLIIEKADGRRLIYPYSDKDGDEKGMWRIRVDAGHSRDTLQNVFKPVLQSSDIRTERVLHRTTRSAWDLIEKEGLSKMNRNHIQLAKSVAALDDICGRSRPFHIHISINLQKALDAGIKFYSSNNGMVLTPGDECGFLKPEFFDRVEDAKTRKAIEGWEGIGEIDGYNMARITWMDTCFASSTKEHLGDSSS